MRGDLKSDADYRRALAELRSCVEGRFADRIARAVVKYSSANGGQLPTDTSQLTAYLDPPIDSIILQRYEIVRGDSLPGIPIPAATEWLVTQKNAVDLEYDMRLASCQGGVGSTGSFGLSEALITLAPLINAYVSANNGQLPNDLAPLAQYVTTPDQQAALDKMVQQYKDKKMSSDDLNTYLKMVQRFMTK